MTTLLAIAIAADQLLRIAIITWILIKSQAIGNLQHHPTPRIP